MNNGYSLYSAIIYAIICIMNMDKSNIITGFFEIGKSYPREIIEQVLGYKPGGSDRKGVLGGPNVGYLCLMVTLQKFEYNKDFIDHITGTSLFWSGQKTKRLAESAIKKESGRFFVFVRARLKDSFVYYGEAKPIRFYERSKGIQSEFVFSLDEYAKSDAYLQVAHKAFVYDPIEFREEALRVWRYSCSTSTVNDSSLLITRHIQPIKEATHLESFDPKNSLVLTPEIDNLFSRGIISFSPSTGRIMLPKNTPEHPWLLQNLELMYVDSTCELRDIPSGTEKYLSYHNTYLFNYHNCDNRWQLQ